LKISTAMGSKSFFQSWWRCIKWQEDYMEKGGVET
jgi:hypothetical protein